MLAKDYLLIIREKPPPGSGISTARRHRKSIPGNCRLDSAYWKRIFNQARVLRQAWNSTPIPAKTNKIMVEGSGTAAAAAVITIGAPPMDSVPT